MKQVKGVWLPDEEERFLEYAVKDDWTYQYSKLESALKFVKNKSLAVDVGAHCGLWSKELIKIFDRVVAFEPLKRHQECFRLNVPKAELYPYALADKPGTIDIRVVPKMSGVSHIDAGESEKGWRARDYQTHIEQVEVRTLDSFALKGVGFLKMDCEGYEYFVVKGGAKTILESKPVIIVEQKPGNASKYGINDTQACTELLSMGAKSFGVIHGDYCFGW